MQKTTQCQNQIHGIKTITLRKQPLATPRVQKAPLKDQTQ